MCAFAVYGKTCRRRPWQFLPIYETCEKIVLMTRLTAKKVFTVFKILLYMVTQFPSTFIFLCTFTCCHARAHTHTHTHTHAHTHTIHTTAQNNHQKLVGHLFKIGRLSMASPLEMYSKIWPTKLDLVDHMPKWVGI